MTSQTVTIVLHGSGYTGNGLPTDLEAIVGRLIQQIHEETGSVWQASLTTGPMTVLYGKTITEAAR